MAADCIPIIDQLYRQVPQPVSAFADLIRNADSAARRYAGVLARRTAVSVFGRRIFIRGLIEFSSYCRNDCHYCGLRRSNSRAARYRLSDDEVLQSCAAGYGMGCRTFVLQGGEDAASTTARIAGLVRQIKSRWPDTAVTLSLGERPRTDYAAWYAAGADRYLLRQETASPALYRRLHPPPLSLENRMRCLRDLKAIGFQTGAGFLVGPPGQTADDLARDLSFMQSFRPEMAGIGPFLPQRDTPFAKEPPGDLELTLFLISLLRLMLPRTLIPATTAIGSLSPGGRERAILAGANVVMPNLSPPRVRGQYNLYDHKTELLQNGTALNRLFQNIGYEITVDRGDFPAWPEQPLPHQQADPAGPGGSTDPGPD